MLTVNTLSSKSCESAKAKNLRSQFSPHTKQQLPRERRLISGGRFSPPIFFWGVEGGGGGGETTAGNTSAVAGYITIEILAQSSLTMSKNVDDRITFVRDMR